jgi:hypothetical protein
VKTAARRTPALRALALPLALPLALALALALPAAGGCIVAIGDGGEKRPSMHMRQPTAHGPHCADIELARGIGFSNERNGALARIAAQPDLSEHEQLFLIDATAVPDGFSSDKTKVLVALANNPALTQAARERLAIRVPNAELMSSDVERISQALLPE